MYCYQFNHLFLQQFIHFKIPLCFKQSGHQAPSHWRFVFLDSSLTILFFVPTASGFPFKLLSLRIAPRTPALEQCFPLTLLPHFFHPFVMFSIFFSCSCISPFICLNPTSMALRTPEQSLLCFRHIFLHSVNLLHFPTIWHFLKFSPLSGL